MAISKKQNAEARDNAPANVAYYKNAASGELAPPHRIGVNEDGLTLYQFVKGWIPVDYDSNEVECAQDYDGNWIEFVTS